MKALFVYALLGFSLSLSAQSSNWQEVIETNSIRNFEGYLFQNGNDINACIDISGSEYPILAAAMKIRSESLFHHILNNQSLDLSAVCADKTILQYAVEFGQLSHVKKLIAAGANPNQVNKQGKTALDYAKMYEKPVMAGILKQQ